MTRWELRKDGELLHWYEKHAWAVAAAVRHDAELVKVEEGADG